MSLENTQSIDIIVHALDKRPNGVDLLIIDSGDIADELRRYNLFIEKIGVYVNYVMSGEFKVEFPNTSPTNVVIRTFCRTPPNDAMQQVHAIYPTGDRINRIPVVFRDLADFVGELGSPVSDD